MSRCVIILIKKDGWVFEKFKKMWATRRPSIQKAGCVSEAAKASVISLYLYGLWPL